MLKGIDPLLSGDLLKILNDMGHGDELVLVDRNFPAFTPGSPVVSLGEVGVARAATAILSVFPLDTFIERPLERMEVQDDASIELEHQSEVLRIAQEQHGSPLEFGVIPRFEFYERAAGAFAVVQTLESAPYGCFILTKGVV